MQCEMSDATEGMPLMILESGMSTYLLIDLFECVYSETVPLFRTILQAINRVYDTIEWSVEAIYLEYTRFPLQSRY